jgi:virginiamycin A acetyltransferase
MIIEYSDISFVNAIRSFNVNDGDIYTEYPLVRMGNRSYIAGSQIESNGDYINIIIGKYCSIGHKVEFLFLGQHDYTSLSTYPWNNPYDKVFDYKNIIKNENQIFIGHDVWIGRAVKIKSGVKIGNGAVIANDSMVVKDVPPYAIVGGNPAKIIKYRFSDTIIEKLNKIKWWYWAEDKIAANKEKVIGVVETFVNEFYDEKQFESERYAVKAITSDLEELRSNGYKIYYFLPDFTDTYSVWKEVLAKYLHAFTSEDKVALVVGVDKPIEHKKYIDEIFTVINSMPYAVPNLYVQEIPEGNFQFLSSVDCFVTTKEYRCVKAIDYAYDYGVKLLSGLNESIF